MSGERPRRRKRRSDAASKAAATVAQERVVLYRCPTPTNFLCPCGAVERRLRKKGIHHRVERVPYSKRDRPEIEELSKQKRVPVLVYGDEVIHDSRRILQHLDYRDPEPS
jgi:hypothetical protein